MSSPCGSWRARSATDWMALVALWAAGLALARLLAQEAHIAWLPDAQLLGYSSSQLYSLLAAVTRTRRTSLFYLGAMMEDVVAVCPLTALLLASLLHTCAAARAPLSSWLPLLVFTFDQIENLFGIVLLQTFEVASPGVFEALAALASFFTQAKWVSIAGAAVVLAVRCFSSIRSRFPSRLVLHPDPRKMI